MAVYTIRSGFSINLLGTIYQGGQEIELSDLEFQLHKHKLEGVKDDVVIPSQGGGGKSDCVCYPAPYLLQVEPQKIITGRTTRVTIRGSFFTPDTTVNIEESSIERIEFVNSHELNVWVIATNTARRYDLILDNGTKVVFDDTLEFFDVPAGLVDLRLGRTSFGDAAIEMRSSMSYTRTVDGLIFDGSSPWSSWARFVGDNNSWVWNRSTKKTLTWIFQNTGNLMIGIGSFNNDESSNQQYNFGELLSYVPSSVIISSLFGNNGNPGTGVNQSFSTSKNAEDIIALVFTNNGENGGTFSVYRLKNAEVSSWFDREEKLGEIEVGGFGSDESEIMPFVIPNNGVGSKFLGFIIEDE